MTGIGTAVNTALDGISAELLLVLPAGLGVAGLIWGAPKAVAFFKRIAK